MTNSAVRSTSPSGAALAAELERLGLRFVSSSPEDALPFALSTEDLIAALARSKEARLQLGLKASELPDIFGHSLALPLNSSANDLLLRLAEQQIQMSGRPINWYGTYEHAMERFIRRLKLEAVWAKS